MVHSNEPKLGGTNERLAAILSCGVLGAILIALDSSELVESYSHTGIGNHSYSDARIAGSVLCSMVIGGLLPSSKRLPAALAVWPLAVLIVIPAVVLTPSQNPYWWTGITVPLVGFAVLLLAFRSGLQANSMPRVSRDSFLLFLGSLAVLMTALIVGAYGISLNFASLESMYQVRAEFESRAAQGSPIAAYASGWLVNVVAPSLTGLGVLWRKYVYALVGSGSMVMHYLAVPSKLVLLLPAVAALVGLYLRQRSRMVGPASVATGLSALILLVWNAFPEPGNNAFAILVYRTVYVPLDVALMWIEFFTNNPRGNFADAIPVVASEYDATLPKVISGIYGTGRGNFNANLWADGYGNLGMWGVAIASLVIGSVLTVINLFAQTRDARACAVVLLGPSVALLNNSAFTTLLSGGLSVAIGLIYLLPGPEVGRQVTSSCGRDRAEHEVQ